MLLMNCYCHVLLLPYGCALLRAATATATRRGRSFSGGFLKRRLRARDERTNGCHERMHERHERINECHERVDERMAEGTHGWTFEWNE